MRSCTHKDHIGPNPLPLESFGKDRSRKDGLHSQCKACRLRTKQTWYAKNKQRVADHSRAKYLADHEHSKEVGRIRSQAYKKSRGISWSLLSSVKTRAKKKGLEFDLSENDLVIPDVCPILGIPLIKEVGERTDAYPSVDRIDSSKGYTKDNVLVMSWRANCLKRDATLEELILLGKFAQNASI